MSLIHGLRHKKPSRPVFSSPAPLFQSFYPLSFNMLSNTSLLVSLGLASLAQAGPRRFRRDEDSDSGVDPWTQFEDQECQRSDFTADYSREDVDELLQSLKDEAEEKVTIPAGEEGSNNRFFYCKAAGLIIGNHGDNDKRLSLSSFSVSQGIHSVL